MDREGSESPPGAQGRSSELVVGPQGGSEGWWRASLGRGGKGLLVGLAACVAGHVGCASAWGLAGDRVEDGGKAGLDPGGAWEQEGFEEEPGPDCEAAPCLWERARKEEEQAGG